MICKSGASQTDIARPNTPVKRGIEPHKGAPVPIVEVDRIGDNGRIIALACKLLFFGLERPCPLYFARELLDALGLEPAETDAIGFSIGGDVLRTLIVERGMRFRHVIMAASAPPGIERFRKEFFAGALEWPERRSDM
jgi:pimeloyl-ACP methyl ester carboxylesterase